MKQIFFGIAATIAAAAASAAHSIGAPVTSPTTPLPVTVQNTPLQVSIADGTAAINTWRAVNERIVQSLNGVPSVAVLNVFLNQSSTTAQVFAYASSPSSAAFPCGSDPQPTSVDVAIFPIGQPATTGLQVPMTEHLTARKSGADYCSAAMSVGPLFIPPGNQLDFNVVYSTLPSTLTPVKFSINVNGFYMK
jgi:hypothetical protein